MKKGFLLSLVAATVLATTSSAEVIPNPFDIVIETDTTSGRATSVEYKYQLKTGWNMLGLAGYKTYKIAELFGSSDVVKSIFTYNPATSAWTSFATANETDSSVKTLVPGMGYWISVTKPFTISYKSNVVSQVETWEKALVTIDASSTSLDINGSQLTITATPLDVTTLVDANGTIDATALNADSNGSLVTSIQESDGNASTAPKFVFDMALIGNSEWTDVAGRKYKFLGTQNRHGVVTISDATGSEDSEKSGTFTIAASGILNMKIELEKLERPDKKKDREEKEEKEKKEKEDKKEKDEKEKADKKEKDEKEKSEKKEKEEKEKSEKKEKDDDKDSRKFVRSDDDKEEKSSKKIKLSMKIIDIEKTGTSSLKLKLINKITKAPNIWTLTKFYNPETRVWTSATAIPSESSETTSVTDVDEDNIVWEAVDGTSDTSLTEIDDINQTATTTTTTTTVTTDTNTTI